MFIGEDGALELWVGDPAGDVERIGSGVPLRPWVPVSAFRGLNQGVHSTTWCFVAATFDAAGWEVGFEFEVPASLRSGVYAVRLRAGEGEDHVPFYVRPGPGTARAPIAFLAPTFSRPGDPVGARRGGVPN